MTRGGTTRSRNVRKSPVKNGDTADKDVIEDEEERSCECRTYIEEEYSLACASCDMYWHYCCVGLTGLTQEEGNHLSNWRCQNCFISPHIKSKRSQTSNPDNEETKTLRNVIRQELDALTPCIRGVVENAVNEKIPTNLTSEKPKEISKIVNQAFQSWADVTASSQKKVIEEMSLEQASQSVVTKVQTRMHTDTYERNLRKLNLCVLNVPESKKANSKLRQEEDSNFCKETLKIEKSDFISCHRAGKVDPDKPDSCRPLIIQTADEESVNFYSNHGKGWKESSYWINLDLCRADREIRFLAREERKKRREEAEKKKTEKKVEKK